MPCNASGRQPSPESYRPGKETTITTTETVTALIYRDLLYVNSIDLNRRDPANRARLWLLRDWLHRHRQNAILDDDERDEARLRRYRSEVSRVEHKAAALEAKGDQQVAKTLHAEAEALRLQINDLRSSRAAKRLEFEESERRHHDLQYALDEEIFANLDEIFAALGSSDEGRRS